MLTLSRKRDCENLWDRIAAHAARLPEKTAVIIDGRALTYCDLDRRSRDLAGRLLAEGLEPGDRVAVHWPNAIECVLLLLACLRSGLVAVPVNIRFKAAEIAHVMEHAAPAAWFSQPELAGTAREAAAMAASAPPIRTGLPQGSAQRVLAPPEIDGIAAILFTSGTTARPKGVVHTQASLMECADLMRQAGVSEAAIMFSMTSMMHVTGLSVTLLGALLSGATAVFVPVCDPAPILDTIERHRCTWLLGLPSMVQFLAAEQERAPRDVASLRNAYCGGDIVPVPLQQRFRQLFGAPLWEIHGMTESAPIMGHTAGAVRPGATGHVLAGVEARIVDAAGAAVPEGEIGELVVRSRANFTGYWGDPAASAAVLKNGWLSTGDLFRRDKDGFLWFEGRRKEIIIRGGSNLSPQEVETALYEHPAVLESGVVGMPCDTWGEKIIACVALRPGQAATETDLRAFVRERIADYKVPERIVFLDVLPKGITGKIHRRALKDMIGAQ